uniref:Sulfhydryl oxidase n=1 Tax=Ostreococcus mediterraneus TaxID=1486918 RepID=A0A7S0PN19_9CHLO|mmetsp:Transcript_701/g.2736  ORF Transcript_701/g.2736 Transcript_701/m.2736 type:complete len:164 (+) Transcript_701:28-519(+)
MPPPAAECTDGACARKSEMFTAMRDALHAVDGARAASSPPCPLDIDSLGTSSWGLFHTLAAYYPDAPSATHKIQARRFFDALGDLYPCSTCRADLRADIDRNPPRVESREALSRWVCERHNEVNAKLGKPRVSCAIDALDKRWRKGPGYCDGDGMPQRDDGGA